MRYFLVDRIDELKKGSYAIGTKCVTLSEDCFEHHFPGQPVFPGTLLLEAMAQLGGALLEITLRKENEPCPRCVLSGAKAKFREFVRPGDVLRLDARAVSIHEEAAKVQVAVLREDKAIAEAELLFVFLKIPDPALEASRRQYLDILTRATRFVD